MIPEVGASRLDSGLVQLQQPSLTWKLDLDRGKITGKTDGLDAVKQAVLKSLQTDRFWYDIYSFDYGHELKLIIGNPPQFVTSEVKRMIEEALLIDDRITAVKNVETSISSDLMNIQFTVTSIYGSFEGEVTSNV
ncbi:MAG: DUF2634 domain-containing protein [Candidatus Pristimantibacillus lignocellulolyticus]|uniref:DUF2634 domain-containing protein n=1 Tax=Candidatus Pristimantibacillus lignocellulolyticus TaxID=2994561 RepID=A0A9J6ZEN4_9BACL|nr:MAG: DUF2634 domain-containing protein [Candidatus Pristimantibacillus lignocellulolyticus]